MAKTELLFPFLERLTGVPIKKLPFKRRMEYIRVCIEDVWGHASMDRDFYEAHKEKIDAIVNDKGWEIITHTTMTDKKGGKIEVNCLCYGIQPKVGFEKLQFGSKPSKKTMKEMAQAARED